MQVTQTDTKSRWGLREAQVDRVLPHTGQDSQARTQSSTVYRPALARPRALLPTASMRSSPLPKFHVIPEPGVAGGQQILQERSCLLPGGRAQAHEAVESQLGPEHKKEITHTQETPGAWTPC